MSREEGDGDLRGRAVRCEDPSDGVEEAGEALGAVLHKGHWREIVVAREPVLLLTRPGDATVDSLSSEVRELGAADVHGSKALLPNNVGDDRIGVSAVAWAMDDERFGESGVPRVDRTDQTLGLDPVAGRRRRGA